MTGARWFFRFTAAQSVGLRFFVEPALRTQLGLPRERALRVPLAHEAVNKSGLRFF